MLVAQKWAERRRRMLVIAPANLRKQWTQKFADKVLKLRTSEADKVRCGQRRLEALGVPFAVVVTAGEV